MSKYFKLISIGLKKNPVATIYFNKFYNTYLIESTKLLVTIQKSMCDSNTVSIKTENLYIESKKYKNYRKN